MRFPVPLMRIRLVLFALAVCWLLIALGIGASLDTEVFFPRLWPVYFVACAILTAVYAVAIWSRPLFLLTGFMLPAGFLFRFIATWARAEDGLIDRGRVLSALGLYASLGITSFLVWVTILGPITKIQQHSRG